MEEKTSSQCLVCVSEILYITEKKSLLILINGSIGKQGVGKPEGILRFIYINLQVKMALAGRRQKHRVAES